MKPKIIAFYLPQFHEIPENNLWWGKGFTEWTNVKKSKPSFKGHYQPEVPLNENYYSLLDESAQTWQCNLAKEYGVYGFCYYHYWFSGKKLLEKPMENMLHNKKIDIHFCICWANESWSRTWTGKEKEVLIKQNYDCDINSLKEHFLYLLPFFKDDRYIKIGKRPLFIIYKPHLIKNIEKMLNVWNSLAKENGFDGIFFGHQSCESFDYNMTAFDFGIEFEPFYSRAAEAKTIGTGFKKISFYLRHPYLCFQKIRNKLSLGWHDNYDRIVNLSINRKASDDNYLGAFPGWDNTPRRGKKAFVVLNSNPAKFEDYLKRLFVKNDTKDNNDFIFINAWNEWAEGAHLEPTEKDGLAYLIALRNALATYGDNDKN